MAVSLRVPNDIKRRAAKLADARHTTTHAFMLEAIREKVEAEEVRAAFHADARRRLARMKRSGMSIPAGEVFDYLEKRVAGKSVRRPKARVIR